MDCWEFFDDLAKYLQAPGPREERYVDFTMVMNKADMKWAQYTVGSLSLKPGSQAGQTLTFASLNGDATQYFSDRTWSDPPTDPPTFVQNHPFNPRDTDRLHLSIGLNPIHHEEGPTLTLTLSSWNNAESTSTLKYAEGFVYGIVEDGMYVFAFKKNVRGIPA